MRLQVGGMRGLIGLLEGADGEKAAIGDVDGILAAAEQRFGRLESLPFSEIMREVAGYQVRKRSRRRT
jgi:hypothetical protein